MAWIKGFPNDGTQVIDVPIFVAALAQADLATDPYVGMPTGTTVLTAAYAGGDGAWIMKMTTTNGDFTDWVYLSSGATIGGSL